MPSLIVRSFFYDIYYGVETIMYNLYIAFGIVNFNTNGAYFLSKKCSTTWNLGSDLEKGPVIINAWAEYSNHFKQKYTSKVITHCT